MFCAAWRVARVMFEKDCKSARRACDAEGDATVEGGERERWRTDVRFEYGL